MMVFMGWKKVGGVYPMHLPFLSGPKTLQPTDTSLFPLTRVRDTLVSCKTGET